MKSRPPLFLFLALAFLSGAWSVCADMPFLGAIPVQYVNPGEELVLDMHRFYNAGGEPSLSAPDSREYTVRFDTKTFELHVQPARTKPGLLDVPLVSKQGGKTLNGVLTIVVRPRAEKQFRFKPAGAVKAVSVVGDFNGWDPAATPLKGPDAAGEYTASVMLGGGKFGYDFVADGKWLTDARNPDTEADAKHGEHSVVEFTPEAAFQGPSIYAEWRDSDPDKLGMMVHAVLGNSPLEKVSAIFESMNGECISWPVESKNDAIRLLPLGNGPPMDRIGRSSKPNTPPYVGCFRVIVSDGKGNVSNALRVPLRDASPWQDAVMYYALTDRFADGDTANDKPVQNPDVTWPANYHGGDLRGIRQKIEEGYFGKLGVNTIWIAPLNRNPDKAYREFPEPHRWYTGYHGYWPVSPTEIDPHFGDPAELKALVKAAHEHGIKVVADLVLHHVHEDHPWWKEHPDWFGSLKLPDGRQNLRLWDEQQFTTWFEPFLPSFDFSKDEPTQALIDNTVWWAKEYDLDGFRLDAVKHILPRFWYQFRAALRERVDSLPGRRDRPLYLVGETFKDREGIASFVGPNMLDGQFDFPLYDTIKNVFALGKGDMATLEAARAASDRVYGKEALMSPLIGNHDKARFLGYVDGDVPGDVDAAVESAVGWSDHPPKVDHPESYRALELAQAYLLTLDGVPMLYYGDEAGMTGAGDPDNRRDMTYGDAVPPGGKDVLTHFQKLGALRAGHPALRYGSRRVLRAEGDIDAFIRAHLQDRVLAVFNKGKAAADLTLPIAPEFADGDYVDALTSQPLKVTDGKVRCTVPAQSVVFMVAQKP